MGSAAGAPWPDTGHASWSPSRPPALAEPDGDSAERIGVDELSWDQLADAVWLAAAVSGISGTAPPSAAPPDIGDQRLVPTGFPDRSASTSHATGRDLPAERGTRESGEPRHAEPLWLVTTDADLPTRPAPGLVLNSLTTLRALRPLKRLVDDLRPGHVVLDEDATAERAAQDGLWWPVTKPDRVRWLDVTVVVDTAPSMVLWRSTVAGFLAQIEHAGAFRTVVVRSLDTYRGDGEPIPAVRGATPKTPSRSPGALVDVSGRRVVLVLTDGIAESWRRDRISPMLARWGESMSVAVIALLPQRLWPHTGLGVRPARLTVPGPMRPNRSWRLELADAWLGSPANPRPGVVPIPVLELGPRWLGWWARLVTGHYTGAVDGAVLLADRRIGEDVTESGSETEELSAQHRVMNWASVASPHALRLAGLLAAVPVNVDVARVVQSELVPECGPAALAEVLNSGLLRLVTASEESHPSDPLYVFEDKARRVLLSGARRSETARTVRLVAHAFGDRVTALRHLRAAVDDPHGAADLAPTRENHDYLLLERDVMRALSGPYLSRANRLSLLLIEQQEEPLGSGPTKMAKIIESDESMSNAASRADVDTQDARPVEEREDAIQAVPPTNTDSTPAEHAEVAPVTVKPSSSVPTVWGNVPPRNPNFTGRTDLLDQLHQRLSAGGATAVLPSALHGMGGIGKTQMAVEYIYRHLGEYDVVWWIQATERAQVLSGLSELARSLRLPGGSEAPAAVPAVMEALRIGRPYGRWLLVFDAAEDVEEVRKYFPTNGPGHILVTSRNPDWTNAARPLEVTVFRRAESIELIRNRGPEVDEADANKLAEKLGDLPLAVEQAAAWRLETGMPISEYLRLFDEKVAEILDTSAPTGYEVSVAAAWNVSFDELKNRSPAAHQLLQVCAFFAPDPISRNLFTGVRGVNISPELNAALRDPMQLGRAIRDITRYGLAKIDHRNNTLNLHRLVQLVLRNRMSATHAAEMRHGAHMLLANYDPSNPRSSEHWSRYREVLPHVYASSLVECNDAWGRQLVLNLMQYLYFWGDHIEAEALAQQAMDTWRARLGEEDQQMLEAASYRGLYLWVLGRYQEAAELNSHTLELRRTVSGENKEETIIAELRVAVDTRTRGDFYAALEMGDAIYTKANGLYGEDDPITLQTAHDLAVTVRLCGNYRRAFELNERTSRRRAEVFGPDSPDTLNTLSGMYMDRRELGEYPRARSEHEDIAERVKNLVGEDKAETLRRMAYLAVAQRKDGDHRGALALSTRVLELFRLRYGDDNPYAMACAISHSIDLRHDKQFEQAHSLGEQTFNRYRDLLGEHHPLTLSASVDLALTKRLWGKAADARQVDDRSLGLLRKALGPDHPYSIVCAINLASDLAALGDPDTALSVGTDAFERSTRILGEDHPTTLAASLNQTLDLRSVERHQEAEIRYADVLRRYRRVLGDRHPGTSAAAAGERANCDIDPAPM